MSSGGFTALRAVFMTTSRVCVSERLRPHRWSRGLPHQAAFAQVLGFPRWLRQRFLLEDLSIRLGHPDRSLHSSAVMWKQPVISVNSRTRFFLTRRVFYLSGTRPAGTPSLHKSRCWSRRHEKGCIRNRRSDCSKRAVVIEVNPL